MAGVASLKILLEVTGLDKEYSFPIASTLVGVPAEVFEGYAVLGAATSSLDLGTIAVTDLLGVAIVAVVGNVGILVNDVGTGTPSATAGNQVLKTSEGCFIDVAGGLTAAYTIRLTGSAATTAIRYICIGK